MTSDASIGELVSQVSEQTSRLVRDELRLAQAELSTKGKRAGIGAGLFGGAGLFAAYGLGALVAAAIFALAGPLPGWAAALIVAGGLFLIAGVSALIGKRELKQGTPPVPEQTVASVKQDIAAIRPGDHS